MTDSLTFLGTSDGLPSADRHHASLLLKCDGQTVLLDCGEPCSHTLKQMRIDFNAIDAVIITHTHSDHVGGLPMLIQSMWLEQRTRPLTIWMPRRAIAPLRKWLENCFLFDRLFKFRIHWRALTPRSVARVGSIRIQAHRTTHLNDTRKRFARTHPQIGFDAYSLLLQTNKKRIAYSGDLADTQDLKPLCKKRLDDLIVELAHLNPDALIEYLQGQHIRHLVVTHMGRAVRARFRQVKARFSRNLDCKHVTFAADGTVIKI